MKRAIVTLVGRRRDWRLLREAERAETMAGRIVLTVGCIGVNADRSEQDDHDEEMVKNCVALHFDKIRLADEIVWATPDGTAGEHTQADLAFARSLSKPVRCFPAAPAPAEPERP
jgi:hypothetical protein